MRKLLYLCSVSYIINALKINLILDNSDMLDKKINEINIFYNEETRFRSSFFLQNKTCHRLTGSAYFEISCVRFNLESSNLEVLSFRSMCNNFLSDCPHYTTIQVQT